VAALVDNFSEITWKHYAREFERSKAARQVDLEGAVRAAQECCARRTLHRTTPGSFGDVLSA
jgi:hypothetical protein